MPETLTINLEQDISLKARVYEAKERLSDWLNSLEDPFEPNTDVFRLMKYEKNNSEYVYQYVLERGVKSLKRGIFK